MPSPSIILRDKLRAAGVTGGWMSNAPKCAFEAAQAVLDSGGTVADAAAAGLTACQAARAAAPVPMATAAPASGAPVDTLAAIRQLVGGEDAVARAGVAELERRLNALDVTDAVEEALAAAMSKAGPAARRVPLAIAAAAGNGGLVSKLLPYYTAGKPAPVNPVLLTGPPSVGKSLAVRRLGETYDCYLEHGCSPDPAEIDTLLGSACVDDGKLAIVDGVLAQAVRLAGPGGKTVLLLLDEVLRLPGRGQEWMLTFLTGVKTPTGKVYRIRTRRGTNGALEQIEVPVERLHIIGAANLAGANPPEAFWSRWRKIRCDFTVAGATEIAASLMASYGVADDGSGAAKFAAAMAESRVQCAAGNLVAPLDFRILEMACAQADQPTYASVVIDIKTSDAFRDHAVPWDPTTGDAMGTGLTAAARILTML